MSAPAAAPGGGMNGWKIFGILLGIAVGLLALTWAIGQGILNVAPQYRSYRTEIWSMFLGLYLFILAISGIALMWFIKTKGAPAAH